MTMIKNLSKNTVKKYDVFNLREDLNFEDDGNHFRGFDYKGILPITTLRTGDRTYLDIRVDYLDDIQFTWNEWFETEEHDLADEFNGCDEVDLEKLIDNCEKVLAKVNELNEKAKKEEIDMEQVERRLLDEVRFVHEVISDVKANLKWWELSKYELDSARGYMKSLIETKERINDIDIDSLSRKAKKQMCESLEKYGYVKIKETNFYIKELKEFIQKH